AYAQVVERTEGWAEPKDEARIATIAQLARQAVQYAKDEPSALSMAAFAIAYCGDMQGADAAVERAVSLNPNDAGAWSVRGWIHCFLNRPKAAVKAFERARRLSPFDPFGAYFSFGIGIAVFE